MTSFYAPDKLKLICDLCKFTMGPPFWIIAALIDEVASTSQEILFKEEVPI